MRGFPAVMVSSVVTITALDLLVIYLPLLGAERQIDANHIGLLLTVRSMAALISRVFYARLIFGMGRAPLTLASMLASAGAFLLLALSLSLPAMYAILIALGFAMGIASTLTISGVVHLAPPQAYGTALTLRMTGNRIGQIVFPAVAGLLAAATGVAGFWSRSASALRSRALQLRCDSLRPVCQLLRESAADPAPLEIRRAFPTSCAAGSLRGPGRTLAATASVRSVLLGGGYGHAEFRS